MNKVSLKKNIVSIKEDLIKHTEQEAIRIVSKVQSKNKQNDPNNNLVIVGSPQSGKSLLMPSIATRLLEVNYFNVDDDVPIVFLTILCDSNKSLRDQNKDRLVGRGGFHNPLLNLRKQQGRLIIQYYDHRPAIDKHSKSFFKNENLNELGMIINGKHNYTLPQDERVTISALIEKAKQKEIVLIVCFDEFHQHIPEEGSISLLLNELGALGGNYYSNIFNMFVSATQYHTFEYILKNDIKWHHSVYEPPVGYFGPKDLLNNGNITDYCRFMRYNSSGELSHKNTLTTTLKYIRGKYDQKSNIKGVIRSDEYFSSKKDGSLSKYHLIEKILPNWEIIYVNSDSTSTDGLLKFEKEWKRDQTNALPTVVPGFFENNQPKFIKKRNKLYVLKRMYQCGASIDYEKFDFLIEPIMMGENNASTVQKFLRVGGMLQSPPKTEIITPLFEALEYIDGIESLKNGNIEEYASLCTPLINKDTKSMSSWYALFVDVAALKKRNGAFIQTYSKTGKDKPLFPENLVNMIKNSGKADSNCAINSTDGVPMKSNVVYNGHKGYAILLDSDKEAPTEEWDKHLKPHQGKVVVMYKDSIVTGKTPISISKRNKMVNKNLNSNGPFADK